MNDSHSNDLPPGLYDRLLTEGMRDALAGLERAGMVARLEPLPGERAPDVLARHLAAVAGRLLAALIQEQGRNDEARLPAARQAAIDALAALDRRMRDPFAGQDEHPAAPLRLLREIGHAGQPEPARPLIPLSESALLANEPGEPALKEQLIRELASADAVDLLCAFINWHGVRLLAPGIGDLARRGGRLRVLTSTYMGATQRRALDELVRLGAEVRIAYDVPPARTRLHAKAWLFHRDSGFSTVFVGSSNLSHSALLEGVEWNVRLSAADAPGILTHFRTTFERYWADRHFRPYDPDRDAADLDRALDSYAARDDQLEAFLDVIPWPHQESMLEQIAAARARGNLRNLVVAATGTGKTIVAALDYRRLRRERGDLTLLFIAHQERILWQARRQFRNALREPGFGQLFVGGERPRDWRHVFASVQSLSANLEDVRPDQFEMVILDEMHHVAAPTYVALMDHLRPTFLLGLSATPERADGLDTLGYFGGRITAELRLWDALDAALLSPFHYFGLPLDVDLRPLSWERGGYRDDELERAYLDADRRQRARNILAELRRLAPDIRKMRALGFCVTVRHAQFMADSFREAGLNAKMLSGDAPIDVRDRLVQALRRGDLQILFTVDLFNEGVDIPEVDTILLLRPTSSATIFLQKLGRGLRLCEGKACLTVLDFIGRHHRRFRFDRIYRALTGLTLSELHHQVETGFTRLPSGCHIHLEREPQAAILESLRRAIPNTRPALLSELRLLGDVSMPEFLRQTGATPEDLYRGGRTYTALRREAGFLPGGATGDEDLVGPGLERMLDLDDPDLLLGFQEVLRRAGPLRWDEQSLLRRRMLRMLLFTLWPERYVQGDLAPEALEALRALGPLTRELADLCGLLAARSDVLPLPLNLPRMDEIPLRVHCSYSRNEAMAALDVEKPSSLREGVRYFEPFRCDVFFVTLRKDEGDYSPSTLYHDYVLSPREFHWESQSVTRADSPTGRRYVHHREQGSSILLFCREARRVDGRTARYVCLGPAEYVSHRGERPMQIVWRLRDPIPAGLYERFRAAAG